MSDGFINNLEKIKSKIKDFNIKIKFISLLEKARNEFEQNKYSDCIESCKKILAKDSKNSTALRGIGCALQAMENNEKAIEYYSKALENSKTKEIEYTLIGTVYYQMDDLDKAIKYFNLAIDANNDYDEAYEGRNQAMLENHLKIIDLQDSLIKRNLF